MYSTLTPDSSPLGLKGPKSSFLQSIYSPEHSSPLSQHSGTSRPGNSALSQISHRKRQYKSQTSSRTFNDGRGKRRFDDSPAGQLLRDHFKAHCIERVRREKRGNAIRKSRSSDHHLFSSDGFDAENDYGMEMDDDEKEAEDDQNALFGDELYTRVMLNEIRQSRHAMNVSFEREFGSSIDPSMYEDMNALEEGFTGNQSKMVSEEEISLTDAEYEDAVIAEYLAELEESELQAIQERVAYGMVDLDTEDPSDLEKQFTPHMNIEQPSPSRSVYSQLTMSSPPASPFSFRALPFENSTDETTPTPTQQTPITSSCPFCHSQTRLCNQVACSNCITTRSLQYAQKVWMDPYMHSTSLNRSHNPLVAETPTGNGVGAMVLCSSDGCDWCFAL